ncbi:MAG: prc [Verrucomicrobiales bacterium]|nr:prc [Verrucomicrobiales bacterium]
MRILSLLVAFIVTFAAQGQDTPRSTDQNSTRVVLKPSAADVNTRANIAILVTRMMERSHYLQHPFDAEMSAKAFDRYLDLMDPGHLYFTQADLDEFGKYKDHLHEQILNKRDLKPAFDMFHRFQERVVERVDFANEILKSEKFEFTGNDRYTLNRKNEPAPKDLAAAKEIWRQHLRYEMLQEQLTLPQGDVVTSALSPNGVIKVNGLEVSKSASISKTNTFGAKKTPQEIIKSRYARLQRTMKEFTDEDAFEFFMVGLTHAYDPHSDYMGKSQVDNFNISMKLSLFGIGALLGSEDGYCEIKELYEGPATKSKMMKVKDRIVAVAQADKEPVDVVDMPLTKVVELIRGPKGSEVRLTIIPANAPDPSTRRVVTLIRDEIKLSDQEAKSKIIELPDSHGKTTRLGIIDLPSFYTDWDNKSQGGKSTTVDVARLLVKLKKENVNGIILDLRHNGGGSLEEVKTLTGLFIRKGPVVQTKDSGGEINIQSDEDSETLYDGPLIVLTSRFSASASEIMAGALQDYDRALIVGDSSSYGKGTVQSLIQLSRPMNEVGLSYSFNPGALKLTIQKFYRAGGASTQLKGVIPDLILPSMNNYAEVGEAHSENALKWDTIPTAKLDDYKLVKDYVAELRSRLEKRLQEEKDFKYVREDIEQFKKLLADKSVSLNLEQRLKEKKEAEARLEARKKERVERKDNNEKVYDITLAIVDKPGLPPENKTNEIAAAVAKLPDDADESEKLAVKANAADVNMGEAKRIMLDYMDLIANRSITTTKVTR